MISLLLAILLPSFSFAGGMLSQSPIAVRNDAGISHWVQSAREGGTEFECRPMAELTGAILCAAGNLQRMNSVFARISMYAEGIYGSKQGEVAEQNSKAHRTAMEFAGGHDLRGNTIAAFFADADRGCQINSKICLSPSEAEFRQQVAKPAAGLYPSYVVIAVSGEVLEDLPLLLSHEAWHAAFFLHQAFRDAVYVYWRGLPEDERVRIRKALSSIYDTSNEELMVNEFQAYVLQRLGSEAHLGAFYSRHAPALRKIAARFTLRF